MPWFKRFILRILYNIKIIKPILIYDKDWCLNIILNIYMFLCELFWIYFHFLSTFQHFYMFSYNFYWYVEMNSLHQYRFPYRFHNFIEIDSLHQYRFPYRFYDYQNTYFRPTIYKNSKKKNEIKEDVCVQLYPIKKIYK